MTEGERSRRSQLHAALTGAIPSWAAVDAGDGSDSLARLRDAGSGELVSGRVCLTVTEAFDESRVEDNSIVPAAVAVELAAGHVAIHDRTSTQLRTGDEQYDPTEAILRGDVLLSRAFEGLATLDRSASTRSSCLSVLTDGCRRVHEARGLLAGATPKSNLVSQLEPRLGGLVGSAAAIAAVLAGVDDDRVDRLDRTATRFGSQLEFVRLREASILDAATVGTQAAIDRHLEAVVECLPKAARDDVRTTLTAIAFSEKTPATGAAE